MIHQVNLYKEEFRPRKVLLSFNHLLTGTAAILVLAVGVSAAIAKLENIATERRAALTAKVSTLDAEVAALAEALERREQDRTLQRRIDLARRELERGARVIAMLREQRVAPGEQQHFSNVLEAFSRRAKPGVWLREIAMDESGFRFEGYVDDASRVPGYLEGLGQDDVFLGQRFSGMHMTHGDPGEPLSFSLRSTTVPGGEVPNSIALGPVR